jgi:hypothetical protein
MFSGLAQNEWLRQAEASAAAAAAAYECTGRRKAVAIVPDDMVFTADTYVFVLARSRTLAQVLQLTSYLFVSLLVVDTTLAESSIVLYTQYWACMSAFKAPLTSV